MNDEAIAKLIDKMDVLIALTALGALQGKNQREQIEALSRTGLAPKAIAEVVGTSSNTVSVTLSQAKRGKKKSIVKAIRAKSNE
jgi:DNA-binding CsgD family transcriptional regulator